MDHSVAIPLHLSTLHIFPNQLRISHLQKSQLSKVGQNPREFISLRFDAQWLQNRKFFLKR